MYQNSKDLSEMVPSNYNGANVLKVVESNAEKLDSIETILHDGLNNMSSNLSALTGSIEKGMNQVHQDMREIRATISSTIWKMALVLGGLCVSLVGIIKVLIEK